LFEEVQMKKQFLSGAMAVSLAIGMTTSAMGHGGGHRGGGHGGGFHSGGMNGFRGFHNSHGATRGGALAGPARRGGARGRRFVGGDDGGYGGWGYAPDYSGYCSPYAIDPSYCGSSYTLGR
jgi:hypothetical protein